jgi:hypothetical protein
LNINKEHLRIDLKGFSRTGASPSYHTPCQLSIPASIRRTCKQATSIKIYRPRDLTCGILVRVLVKLAIATGQRFEINKTALLAHADTQSAL